MPASRHLDKMRNAKNVALSLACRHAHVLSAFETSIAFVGSTAILAQEAQPPTLEVRISIVLATDQSFRAMVRGTFLAFRFPSQTGHGVITVRPHGSAREFALRAFLAIQIRNMRGARFIQFHDVWFFAGMAVVIRVASQVLHARTAVAGLAEASFPRRRADPAFAIAFSGASSENLRPASFAKIRFGRADPRSAKIAVAKEIGVAIVGSAFRLHGAWRASRSFCALTNSIRAYGGAAAREQRRVASFAWSTLFEAYAASAIVRIGAAWATGTLPIKRARFACGAKILVGSHRDNGVTTHRYTGDSHCENAQTSCNMRKDPMFHWFVSKNWTPHRAMVDIGAADNNIERRIYMTHIDASRPTFFSFLNLADPK